MNKTQIIEAIESGNERSAWGRGVKDLAVDLLDNIESDTVNPNTLEADLLNGAPDWTQYSYGGCALIYDADIAEALCSPSELKRKDGGAWLRIVVKHGLTFKRGRCLRLSV